MSSDTTKPSKTSQTESPTTSSEDSPSASRSSLIVSVLKGLTVTTLVILTAVVMWEALKDVGFLFGWLIGASKSPIGHVAATAIFGLAGVAGLSVFSSLANRVQKKPIGWLGTCAQCGATLGSAFFVIVFTAATVKGIDYGCYVRIKAEEGSLASKLQRLRDLHGEKLLTDEELASAKRSLLSEQWDSGS